MASVSILCVIMRSFGHLVGAGLALPSFSRASSANNIQGQGKPCPYDVLPGRYALSQRSFSALILVSTMLVNPSTSAGV